MTGLRCAVRKIQGEWVLWLGLFLRNMVLRGKQLWLSPTDDFCGLRPQEASWASQCTTYFRNNFIYNWEWVLFCGKLCGPINFEIWVDFFSFSLRQLFLCITSYKIISLSSSNWLPGAHSYITIVSEVAKGYHGHSQQNWAGPGAAHGEKRHWWPRNHGVITESESHSSITCWEFTLCQALRSSRSERISPSTPAPHRREAGLSFWWRDEACFQITTLWIIYGWQVLRQK